ncbi:DUF6082 family protein [Nocardiopsis sp. NPDC058789]|uniref:DUF6082 family protein n=1 Tax=Nocardiopsis sp. NPDC058789 TaxID=3346634 RepID=UPI00366FDA61
MSRPSADRSTPVPPSAADRGAARILPAVVVVLVVLAGLALTLVSPLGLRVFGGTNKEWERLSLIGQTYGAISALIAVLALLGVIVTLVYQARELRRAADDSRRQAMGDLLRMAMSDPDLDECWGPVDGEDDARARKQLMYTNMIVTQWGTSFRAGATPEKRLHRNALEMFRGEVGRDYWAQARTSRLSAPASRADARFNQILDDAYRAALAEAPAPVPRRVPPRPDTRPRSQLRRAAPALLAFGLGGVVTGAVLTALGRRDA